MFGKLLDFFKKSESSEKTAVQLSVGDYQQQDLISNLINDLADFSINELASITGDDTHVLTYNHSDTFRIIIMQEIDGNVMNYMKSINALPILIDDHSNLIVYHIAGPLMDKITYISHAGGGAGPSFRSFDSFKESLRNDARSKQGIPDWTDLKKDYPILENQDENIEDSMALSELRNLFSTDVNNRAYYANCIMALLPLNDDGTEIRAFLTDQDSNIVIATCRLVGLRKDKRFINELTEIANKNIPGLSEKAKKTIALVNS